VCVHSFLKEYWEQLYPSHRFQDIDCKILIVVIQVSHAFYVSQLESSGFDSIDLNRGWAILRIDTLTDGLFGRIWTDDSLLESLESLESLGVISFGIPDTVKVGSSSAHLVLWVHVVWTEAVFIVFLMSGDVLNSNEEELELTISAFYIWAGF